MHVIRIIALTAGLGLAACAVTPPPDTAIMPLTGAGTPIMSDQGAIGLSSYVLGDASLRVAHPVDAARALAAIDYLAGALYSNPRWVGIPPEAKLRMVWARNEVRQALAIAPGASSQSVVDGLIAASNALAGQDEAAAQQALPASVFTLGPERTLALLRNLPPLPVATAAAQFVNVDTMMNCNFTSNCG